MAADPLGSWRFVVPGEPHGKGRARFARAGRFVRTYTPEKTASYEAKVATLALTTKPANWPAADRSVHYSVTIVCAFGVPASLSRIKRLTLPGTGCAKKPDADNIAKTVCDALNGIAWVDDSQVTFLSVRKNWAIQPGVYVAIGHANATESMCS